MQTLCIFACMFLLSMLTFQARAEEDEFYPRDVTQGTLANPDELSRLQSAGEIFFQEGFELPGSLDKWYNRIREKEGSTQVAIDSKLAHSGSSVLQLRTQDLDGRSSGAGCSYWFHPGYDTVYFRRYIKFADDYDQGNLNHVGGSIYAVAGDDRYAQMG